MRQKQIRFREALTTDEGARAFVDVISQEEKRIEVVEKGEKEKGGVKGKKGRVGYSGC